MCDRYGSAPCLWRHSLASKPGFWHFRLGSLGALPFVGGHGLCRIFMMLHRGNRQFAGRTVDGVLIPQKRLLAWRNSGNLFSPCIFSGGVIAFKRDPEAAEFFGGIADVGAPCLFNI